MIGTGMSKMDLQVNDKVRFWYESLHQQVFNWGIIISMDEDNADIDTGNDKYIFTVPLFHIIQREKRPEEIEAELKREAAKTYKPVINSGLYTLKGIRLKDKETGKYLEEVKPVNLSVIDVSFPKIEANNSSEQDNKIEETSVENDEEKSSTYSSKFESKHRYR